MEISRHTTDGLIVQFGVNLGMLTGCDRLLLDDTTTTAVQNAFADPTVGNIFLINVVTNANGISSGQVQTNALLPPPPVDPDVTAFGSNFDTAVTRLQDIITNSGTYTAAQIQTATADEARILLRVLKFLHKTVQ